MVVGTRVAERLIATHRTRGLPWDRLGWGRSEKSRRTRGYSPRCRLMPIPGEVNSREATWLETKMLLRHLYTRGNEKNRSSRVCREILHVQLLVLTLVNCNIRYSCEIFDWIDEVKRDFKR